ncbi:MAG: biotin--[acetyl-CoA-carboxylase] ligase [Actinobacteria bacterium]|nr:MAG: biotin--[acetyl-CoA-carboxylase] ligase [Actinomycetota bacterium]
MRASVPTTPPYPYSDFAKVNMATPYFQFFTGEVPSTQDFAREHLDGLPVVVVAPGQSEGRGRTGTRWENADESLAVSVAWRPDDSDRRPFSLIAGVAAVRVLGSDLDLKWPNDVMMDDLKVGGILVERSHGVAAAGLGLNLYWADPPAGASGISPNPRFFSHRVLGARWAAEFLRLLDDEGWPIEEYREMCTTLGRTVVWEPNGSGIAAGINDQGALLVKTAAGVEEVHAGAVRHVRG